MQSVDDFLPRNRQVVARSTCVGTPSPVVRPSAVLAAACVLIASAVPTGCGTEAFMLLPPRFSDAAPPAGSTLLTRFAVISDTQCLDEESPARFAGAVAFIPSAWRAYEAYTTQLFDGAVRAVNRIHHSGRTIDFALHTGDLCDNAQMNELQWALTVMDGGQINPRSGPDDRSPDRLPPPELDPHAPFAAQGLYRHGIHGPRPSIPWYVVFGNHDAFALGTFSIIEYITGARRAPLPLDHRPGIVLPVILNPTGFLAHGNVTPAMPGPPALLEFPRPVAPNPERRFFNKQEFVHAMHQTKTEPPGHGFNAGPSAPTWYSVAPVPGLRLIGLDTSDVPNPVPGFPYSEGAISFVQSQFLRREMQRASDRGERVIVASHHPSDALQLIYGSALDPAAFRSLLNAFPNVILHLAGHSHRHRVTDRGGYLEIETGSVLDWPQEVRQIEIFRAPPGADDHVAYETLGHLPDSPPPVGDDPLLELRTEAHRRAAEIAQFR